VALTLLRDSGGDTQQGLATALRIDRTNLVGLLNELEALGYVARQRQIDDRRRHNVLLTTDGQDAVDAAESALAEAEDTVLTHLNASERGQLYELLHRATGGEVSDCASAAAAGAACDDECPPAEPCDAIASPASGAADAAPTTA